MTKLEKELAKYDYKFPSELIAQKPAHPRDQARLFIYDRMNKQISHDYFKNLPSYLPTNAVLVLNQTKVLPARIIVTKPTGGKVRLLYIKHDVNTVYFLSDRKLDTGLVVTLNSKVNFVVVSKQNQFYLLKPNFHLKDIEKILVKYGQTPLPPYIKNSPLVGKKLLTEYNTVFANELGSVAAPTASLHFTKNLLNKLKKNGVTIKFVTLHVNLGTFASLSTEQFEKRQLHAEFYEIPNKTASFLNNAKRKGRPIIAVGTTVVRTLESASTSSGQLKKLSGETTLFLTEKSKLKFVDQLITNFHVPKSSLLMLVSAFIDSERLLSLYKLAIQKKYRIFSFGDSMYIK